MDNKTKQDNVPQVNSVEGYKHMTEIEILNLPKDEHKELFLTYRMPEGYNPVRDRKTIMFLEAMFRDGYEIGSGWQKNQDAARIAELEVNIGVLQAFILELESENAKLREALEGILQIEFGYEGEGIPEMTSLAEQALKEKEAKGE